MYAKYKWASMTNVQLAHKRVTAKNDAWILFMKKKITEKEYTNLISIVTSPDVENLVLAIELIKAKNRKKK